jgi:putative serine protease PepD
VVTVAGTRGAELEKVPGGSPAADSGLRVGDVVTEVDGKRITDGISLIVAIRSHQPGETVDVAVQRRGRTQQVQVTLDGKVG